MVASQAVIDDSGSEPQSRIFVLAGFVCTPNGWENFKSEWQAVLDQTPRWQAGSTDLPTGPSLV
jgi:hypothetical protein